MIIGQRILARSKLLLYRQARWASTSSAYQPIFIKELIRKTTKPDDCLAEIDGKSSDIRQGKIIVDSCYLVPQYTPDPSEALTGIRFEKWFKKKPELGEPLISRWGRTDIYMIQEKDQNVRDKITDAALWKPKLLSKWSDLDGKNWPGRSNDIDQDFGYLYILWRSFNKY
ncbi:hypothetical protein G7Y89_g14419 [Cudoniella acicularis]|uniref:Uncharacterized protein n=1 Tax=Cudoniella acicularis TaxID=354080 RepID=A0A8H4VTT9_9HELO|nr:hypothetical protein G7Y89_g14419 [Cudoniella acicularis]